jgi:transposase
LRTLILWHSESLKKLRRLALRNDIDLWFEDECHFQQHGSRCAMWIPPEVIDPVLLHAPTRKSIGVFGAVRSEDGCLVTSREKKFDAMTFLSFLQKLVRHRRQDRKMVVVLDNARWHHARYLKFWLSKHRHILKLVFLPPYSPELNTVERVWKLTRTLCTHNRYFAEIEKLIEAVSNQFEAWRKPNNTLRRLCAII